MAPIIGYIHPGASVEPKILGWYSVIHYYGDQRENLKLQLVQCRRVCRSKMNTSTTKENTLKYKMSPRKATLGRVGPVYPRPMFILLPTADPFYSAADSPFRRAA